MEGQRIAGRYHVERAIGRGGMGTVWLCRDEVLGREVAVKQIGALPGETVVEKRRAMREARSAAALNHPNAVAVYDVADHDGRPWLVMEYVEGRTLADEIAREGRLSPQRVADLGSQLAGALARAHERRIVHRDIKPGNVLIDRWGRPKISDFGIARGHGDDQLTQTGFVTGTPGYLSPELARGGDPDASSDVWALAATLYAAVEGRGPYESRPNPLAVLQAIATQRPRPLEHAGPLEPAIAEMMHEDPAQRWDMATAAKQLGAIARGGSVSVPTAPLAAPTRVAPAVQPEPHEPTQRWSPAAAAATPADPEVAQPPTPPTPVAAVPQGPVDTGGRDDSDVIDTRRRGRALPVVAFVLLLLLLLGGYLLSHRGGQDPAPTAGVTTRPSTPAPRPTSGGTPTGQTATPTSSPSSPSSSPTSATSSPTSSATSSSAGTDAGLAQFVRSYFANVTGNRDVTWAELTPGMQAAAGGRSGYEQFWSTIAAVRVGGVQADASGGSATARLTYVRQDGTTSTERHAFTFVRRGGSWLISSEHMG